MARCRLGSGLVVAFAAAVAVTLAVSAGIAALAPAPATPPAASTGSAGRGEVTKTVTSKSGRFSVSVPSSYSVQTDVEGDNGLVFFAATAGEGFGDFAAEGVTIMLVEVKPGSPNSPADAGDLWNTLNGLTDNPTRCLQSGGFTSPGGKAISPPDGVSDHQDWEWNGCPNGGVERDFAYFEPTGRYGVVIAARSQDPDTAKSLVTRTMDSLELIR